MVTFLKSFTLKLAQWSFLIAINCLALFLILNMSVWGYTKLTELRTQNNQAPKPPMWHKKSNQELEKLFPKLSKQEIDQLISDNRRILQEYDPYTQFKEAPYHTRFVNVDVNGFRRSINQGPWPPRQKDFVIFFYGGSTSFGYGVPDTETVASHLQEILRSKLGMPVTVYNFGRGAYFSSQERVLFEKHLQDGHIPEMVIFMDGINEFSHVDGVPSYTNDLREFMREHDIPLHTKLFRELPLIRFIGRLGTGSDRHSPDIKHEQTVLQRQSDPEILRAVVRRYMMNKRIVEAICKDIGITCVFVWQPTPIFGHDLTHHIFRNFDYDSYMPHLKHGYEFVAGSSTFRELSGNFIWLADIDKPSDRPLYVSAFHYGPEMSNLVANSIVDAMIDRNLIPVNSAIPQGIVTMSGVEAPKLSVSGTK